jgi:surfeit locus 1 family protein
MIRFRPLPKLTVWFLFAFALLIGLGVWQVQRLQWKENLIATVNVRIGAAPVALDEALRSSVDDAEWRHVSVSGTFLHDREVYLFGQSKEDANGDSGVGVDVITPLRQANGDVVLVDRGFVPQDKKDPATRAAGQVPGSVTITGVLRASQEPGYFTPVANARDRMVFARDVPAIAALAGVKPARPIVIQADATPNPGGWPLGGQTVVDFPNNHLQYAITWFALAFIAMVFYLLYHRAQGRLSFGRDYP